MTGYTLTRRRLEKLSVRACEKLVTEAPRETIYIYVVQLADGQLVDLMTVTLPADPGASTYAPDVVARASFVFL